MVSEARSFGGIPWGMSADKGETSPLRTEFWDTLTLRGQGEDTGETERGREGVQSGVLEATWSKCFRKERD